MWLVETAKSNRFCFGDMLEVKAFKAVKFPVTLVGVECVRAYIEVDMIKNDLPLLLSHKSMKTAGMLLNFQNASCWNLSRYIKLPRTTCGYYSVILWGFRKMYLNEEKESWKIILLICLCIKERLISWVKDCRLFHDKEFLDLSKDVCDSCSVCLRFWRPSLSPVAMSGV